MHPPQYRRLLLALVSAGYASITNIHIHASERGVSLSGSQISVRPSRSSTTSSVDSRPPNKYLAAESTHGAGRVRGTWTESYQNVMGWNMPYAARNFFLSKP